MICFDKLSNEDQGKLDKYKEQAKADNPETTLAKQLGIIPQNALTTNNTLVTCFSEESVFMKEHDGTKCSDKMWAQYANSHYGVCLVFSWDLDKLENNFVNKNGYYLWQIRNKTDKEELYEIHSPADPTSKIRMYWEKVNYSSELNSIKFKDGKSEETVSLIQLFATKSSDWEREREHRLIIRAPTGCGFSGNTTYFLQYKECCLEGIIFGLRTLELYKEVIKNYFSQSSSTQLYESIFGDDGTITYRKMEPNT